MLREIQEELGLTKLALQRELQMDVRTIEKLIEDSPSDPWRLDRESLHRFLLFAHTHGFEAFHIESNAIWRTLNNSSVIIYRGPGKEDVPVENHLVNYFERINCEVSSSTTTAGIEEAMRQHNCVIIGSPNANPASEIGLASLWKATPFQGEAENREKIPISFLGMKREPEESSALLQDSTRHGILIRPPGSEERNYLKVDWLPPEKDVPHGGIGQDGAVLVVCHQPMGTQKNVTTIVIAGYTGLATLVAAQEVTYKEIPELQPERTPGQPCFAALKFRYRIRRLPRARPQALDYSRIPEEESVTWAPPWRNLFNSLRP